MSGRMRPDRDNYFLNIAEQVAKRSTCISRINGALVVKDNKVVGAGYNGWAAGSRNCSEIYLLPERPCPRLAKGFKTGEGYEVDCKAVHAEANALLNCATETKDGTLYLYTESIKPDGEHFKDAFCLGCLGLMLNAGIERGVVKSMAQGTFENYVYYKPELKKMYLERKK